MTTPSSLPPKPFSVSQPSGPDGVRKKEKKGKSKGRTVIGIKVENKIPQKNQSASNNVKKLLHERNVKRYDTSAPPFVNKTTTLRQDSKINYTSTKNTSNEFQRARVQSAMNAIRTIEAAAQNDNNGYDESMKNMGMDSVDIKVIIEKIKSNKTISHEELVLLSSTLKENSGKIVKKIEQWKSAGKPINEKLEEQMEEVGKKTVRLQLLFNEFHEIVAFQSIQSLFEWLEDVDKDVNTLSELTQQIVETQGELEKKQNKLSETKADKEDLSQLEQEMKGIRSHQSNNNQMAERIGNLETGFQDTSSALTKSFATLENKNTELHNKLVYFEKTIKASTDNLGSTIEDANNKFLQKSEELSEQLEKIKQEPKVNSTTEIEKIKEDFLKSTDELAEKIKKLEQEAKGNAGPTTEEIRNKLQLQKKHEELAEKIRMFDQKYSANQALQQSNPVSVDYESRIKNIEDQLQEAKSTAEAAEEKSENAEKKASQAQQDVDEMKPKLQALTEQLDAQKKELSTAKEELGVCKKSISEGKDKQQKLENELQKRAPDNHPSPIPEQLTSPSQSDPQEEPAGMGDLGQLLQEMQARITDGKNRLLALEEEHDDFDNENNELNKKQEQLQNLTTKVSQASASPHFFVETTDKLKTGADKLDQGISAHTDEVKGLTEKLRELQGRLDHLEDYDPDLSDEHDDYSEDNIPSSPDRLAKTDFFKKAASDYGTAWEETAKLIEKKSSLELLKGAQSALKLLADRNSSDRPKTPFITVKIDGIERQVLPPDNWLNNLPDDEYHEVIKQTMQATSKKKAAVKKECGSLAKRSTDDTIANINKELGKIETRLKKEKKNVSAWQDDKEALKKYLSKHLVLEIDDSYWRKKQEKDPTDAG